MTSALLAALIAYSAVRKLTHDEAVVASYAAAGVPEAWLDRLAGILLAGAAGLVGGLAWAPLGIAVAGCLVAYFLVAAGFHIRSGDDAHLPTPLVLLALAAAALILRLSA